MAVVHGAIDVVIAFGVYRCEHTVLCWVACVYSTCDAIVAVVIDWIELTPFGGVTPVECTANSVVAGSIFTRSSSWLKATSAICRADQSRFAEVIGTDHTICTEGVVRIVVAIGDFIAGVDAAHDAVIALGVVFWEETILHVVTDIVCTRNIVIAVGVDFDETAIVEEVALVDRTGNIVFAEAVCGGVDADHLRNIAVFNRTCDAVVTEVVVGCIGTSVFVGCGVVRLADVDGTREVIRTFDITEWVHAVVF